MNSKLETMKPVTQHVYSVLSQSPLGRNSSVGQHLCFKFKVNALADHQYCDKKSFEKNVLAINSLKETEIKNNINKLLYGRNFVNDVQNIQNKEKITDKILQQNELNVNILHYKTQYPEDETYKKIKEKIASQNGDKKN